MSFRLMSLAVLLSLSLPFSAQAVYPSRYGLDEVAYHPDRFFPPYGVVLRSSGLPRYVMPGYGYRLQGPIRRSAYADILIPSSADIKLSERYPWFYDDWRHRNHGNSYVGPWYHPDWPANTRNVWTSW